MSSYTYHDTLPMPTPIPVRIGNLNILFLHFFLLPEPLLPQFLSFSSFPLRLPPTPTPVSRSNVLVAMSLNGLDNPTVLEAYQTVLTEAGGW